MTRRKYEWNPPPQVEETEPAVETTLADKVIDSSTIAPSTQQMQQLLAQLPQPITSENLEQYQPQQWQYLMSHQATDAIQTPKHDTASILYLTMAIMIIIGGLIIFMYGGFR